MADHNHRNAQEEAGNTAMAFCSASLASSIRPACPSAAESQRYDSGNSGYDRATAGAARMRRYRERRKRAGVLVEFEVVGITLEDLVALSWARCRRPGEPHRGGPRDRCARRPRAADEEKLAS